MNYSVINQSSIENGLGVRVSLFVSGCRNHCRGCFQPETWDFSYGKPFDEIALQKLIGAMKHSYISGLSILGGDPLEPENQHCVEYICRMMKWHFRDKDIWLYTGYTYEDVKDLPVLRNVDVVVDGRFEIDKKVLAGTKYYGSSNQRIIDHQQSMKLGETVLYNLKK